MQIFLSPLELVCGGVKDGREPRDCASMEEGERLDMMAVRVDRDNTGGKKGKCGCEDVSTDCVCRIKQRRARAERDKGKLPYLEPEDRDRR